MGTAALAQAKWPMTISEKPLRKRIRLVCFGALLCWRVLAKVAIPERHGPFTYSWGHEALYQASGAEALPPAIRIINV